MLFNNIIDNVGGQLESFQNKSKTTTKGHVCEKKKIIIDNDIIYLLFAKMKYLYKKTIVNINNGDDDGDDFFIYYSKTGGGWKLHSPVF